MFLALTATAVAGLWDERTDKRAERDLSPAPRFITEPTNFVTQAHDRMPVILHAKDFRQWEQGDVKDAAALMKSASTLSVTGVECTYGGKLWDFYQGMMICPIEKRSRSSCG